MNDTEVEGRRTPSRFLPEYNAFKCNKFRILLYENEGIAVNNYKKRNSYSLKEIKDVSTESKAFPPALDSLTNLAC